MFAAEFEPAQAEGRRRSPRASVSLDARIGFGRTLCKVTDLSIHGARLMTYSALRRGSTILLTLPQVGQCAAKVMWSDDYIAGCQFQKPLDPAAFELLRGHDSAIAA